MKDYGIEIEVRIKDSNGEWLYPGDKITFGNSKCPEVLYFSLENSFYTEQVETICKYDMYEDITKKEPLLETLSYCQGRFYKVTGVEK